MATWIGRVEGDHPTGDEPADGNQRQQCQHHNHCAELEAGEGKTPRGHSHGAPPSLKPIGPQQGGKQIDADQQRHDADDNVLNHDDDTP